VGVEAGGGCLVDGGQQRRMFLGEPAQGLLVDAWLIMAWLRAVSEPEERPSVNSTGCSSNDQVRQPLTILVGTGCAVHSWTGCGWHSPVPATGTTDNDVRGVSRHLCCVQAA
jgi:hypothetical protein